ncbi:MAG TPA: (2Fe-2S) ferredoxin domain-containing protein [Clostridia bacterium]|nr:(2Fe-2S) ferredoxin domain-containing protein [Clostridia bacterium]
MEISICVGSACHLKGSYDVIRAMEKLVEENGMEKQITIKAAFCLGQCTKAVSVKFDGKIHSVRKDSVREFFENHVLAKAKKAEAEK